MTETPETEDAEEMDPTYEEMDSEISDDSADDDDDDDDDDAESSCEELSSRSNESLSESSQELQVI